MSKTITHNGIDYTGVKSIKIGGYLFRDEEEVIDIPTEKKTISANGTDIDVKDCLTVDVDVPSTGIIPTGCYNITENNNIYDIAEYKEVSVTIPQGAMTSPVAGSVVHAKFRPTSADNASGKGIEIPFNGFPSSVFVVRTSGTNNETGSPTGFALVCKNGGGSASSSATYFYTIRAYNNGSESGASGSGVTISDYNANATTYGNCITSNGSTVKFKTYGTYAFREGCTYEFWIVKDEAVSDPTTVVKRLVGGRYHRYIDGNYRVCEVEFHLYGSEFSNEDSNWGIWKMTWTKNGSSGEVQSSSFYNSSYGSYKYDDVRGCMVMKYMWRALQGSSLNQDYVCTAYLTNYSKSTDDPDHMITIQMENLTFDWEVNQELVMSTFDESTNTYTIVPK